MIGVGRNHVGGFAPALIGMAESLPAGIERLSPSGLAAPDHPFGRTMTTGKIDATIAAFARAAAAACARDLAAFDRAVLETLD